MNNITNIFYELLSKALGYFILHVLKLHAHRTSYSEGVHGTKIERGLERRRWLVAVTEVSLTLKYHCNCPQTCQDSCRAFSQAVG